MTAQVGLGEEGPTRRENHSRDASCGVQTTRLNSFSPKYPHYLCSVPKVRFSATALDSSCRKEPDPCKREPGEPSQLASEPHSNDDLAPSELPCGLISIVRCGRRGTSLVSRPRPNIRRISLSDIDMLAHPSRCREPEACQGLSSLMQIMTRPVHMEARRLGNPDVPVRTCKLILQPAPIGRL